MQLNYTFEKKNNGKFEVWLSGHFVCTSRTTDEHAIDEKLKETGYESRQEFLEHRLSQYD